MHSHSFYIESDKRNKKQQLEHILRYLLIFKYFKNLNIKLTIAYSISKK